MPAVALDSRAEFSVTTALKSPAGCALRLELERGVELAAGDAASTAVPASSRACGRLSLDLDLLVLRDALEQLAVLGGNGGHLDPRHQPLGLALHEHEAVDHQPEDDAGRAGPAPGSC